LGDVCDRVWNWTCYANTAGWLECPVASHQEVFFEMNRFQKILAKMKRWLKRSHSQQVEVRTFVGDFVAQRKGHDQSAGYDDYLKYAESSQRLRLVSSDVFRLEDGKRLNRSRESSPDGIEQFNQSIAVYCSDFARYVAVLRSQMK